jgi:alcohol dehydrogenase class IV
MRFEFATAGRIVFGAGAVREVAPAAKSMGKRALLLTGASHERAASLAVDLAAAGVDSSFFPVDGEPTIDLVRHGCAVAREAGCDVVIASGGGSTIDTGKAIAALLANPGDPLDYLEVIGSGKSLAAPSVPFIAVPTTAGTGSEVTRNAVLASPEHRVKASLRSPWMLPRLAVVDPELTLDLPPAVTAATGLDALTQLIEPYVSVRANGMTDAFCVEGMGRVARSLVRAFHNGRDCEARTDMSMASLLGGLSLANAGLGIVHGFAAVIGGAFHAPHGAVCAVLLAQGMKTNIRALRARAPGSEPLRRYEVVTRILTGNAAAAVEEGIEWVRGVCRELEIPPLRAYGIGNEHVPELVEGAAKASSTKANPLVLTADEMREMLAGAI